MVGQGSPGRPLRGLIRPFKGLIRTFKGLIRPFKAQPFGSFLFTSFIGIGAGWAPHSQFLICLANRKVVSDRLVIWDYYKAF